MINLYNEKGEIVKIDKGNLISSGSKADIYRIGNGKCIKQFRSSKRKVVVEVLKFFRDDYLSNFLKICDILYDDRDRVRAYTALEYISSEVDLLTLSSDYLIDNLSGIVESIRRISDRLITVMDMNIWNTIVNESEITVIDVDGYVSSNDDSLRDKIYNLNIDAVKNLFINLYDDSLVRYHSAEGLSSGSMAIDDLFMVFDKDTIYKKLSRCRYPIDYLMQNRY